MNRGRAAILAILAVAVLVGGSIYWLQVYAFYREIASDSFEITRPDGSKAVVPVTDWQGIDSSSSPIRFRACFRADPALLAQAAPYARPTPLLTPRWFDCFDAGTLDRALESGEAVALLGEAGVVEGVDRVLAVFPDGRAYAWHQRDLCGPLTMGAERPLDCPPGSGDPSPLAPAAPPPPGADPTPPARAVSP